MKKIYSSLAITVLFLIAFAGNVKATDYFLKSLATSVSGGAVNNLANWADGGGVSPTAFTGNHRWFFTNRTGASLALSITFTTSTTGGTVFIEPGFNLFLSGSFGELRGAPINVASTGTLTIGNTQGPLRPHKLNSLDPASVVIYTTSSAQILPATYGHLRIAGSNTVVAGTLDVEGNLILDATRTMSLTSNILNLNGTSSSIVGTGSLSSNGSAGIRLQNGNGGNNGTLSMAAGGQTLNTLYIQYNSGSDVITLGSDLVISGGDYLQPFGSIDLNGNDLTVDGANVYFSSSASDGVFFGDANSSLHLTPLGYYAGDQLFFDGTQNTLRALSFNGSGLTLQAATPIVILDSLAILEGAFDAASNVTIDAVSARKGRIGRFGATGSISNNLTFRTFISGGGGALTGWMNMGTPGIIGEIVSDWQDDIPMACTGCTLSPPIGGTFTSIQDWAETTSAYVPLTSASLLAPGSGKWVYVGSGASTTTDFTLDNTGPVLQGSTVIPLTAVGTTSPGWNLVANPYSSPISWTAVYALSNDNNIFADIQAWSPDAQNFGAVTQGNQNGTNGMTDVIPAGQGFYIRTSAAANLVFDETVKTDINTTNLMRSSKIGSPDRFNLTLQGQWTHDETMLLFKNGATNNFDRKFDAEKLFTSAGYSGTGNSWSKYTTISTVDSKGQDYAINTMAPLTKSLSLSLRTRVTYPGSYTITAKDAESFGSCLILKDKLTGTVTDLKKSPYAFTISDTTSAPRFELSFCQSEIGPVSVNEIKAALADAVTIGQDQNGAFVSTSFPANTKATISAYNIIGQEVMKEVVVSGTETMTHLNLEIHDQVVIIKVKTDNETVMKKIIAH